MSNDLLQKKYENLLKKVTKMRHYQKGYIKYGARQDLESCKKYQKEVDALILAEKKLQETKQTEIF